MQSQKTLKQRDLVLSGNVTDASQAEPTPFPRHDNLTAVTFRAK
ncbi:hypothetical protein [Methylotuvimicrobium sp. KM1]